LLCLFLTGCQAVRSDPSTASALPTPIVKVTHLSTLTAGITASPEPTATTTPRALNLQEIAQQTYGERLVRQIVIPKISVESPIVTVGWLVDHTVSLQSATAEWDSPGPAVGWVLTSALPDQVGNVILYGHNNMYGSVFKNLGKLAPGDDISLKTGQRTWFYQVDRVLLLPILNATPGQRLAYLAYISDTPLPRLTIISCWPPESNTYRVVVIAYPVQNP
jgi:sortase (surface protein transpeptidase)